jgi:DNA polymerase-1
MRTGLSLPDVKAIRRRYDEIFPGIPAFRDLYIGQAMDHGYVQSPFGPRRYIRVKRRFGRGANQAANAPIQSIPPHVVRRAMVRAHRELPKPARLILNVHDELTVTYPRELRDQVATCLTDILRTPVPELPALPIGMGTGLVFNIDIKIGENWGQLRTLRYENGEWNVQKD